MLKPAGKNRGGPLLKKGDSSSNQKWKEEPWLLLRERDWKREPRRKWRPIHMPRYNSKEDKKKKYSAYFQNGSKRGKGAPDLTIHVPRWGRVHLRSWEREKKERSSPNRKSKKKGTIRHLKRWGIFSRYPRKGWEGGRTSSVLGPCRKEGEKKKGGKHLFWATPSSLSEGSMERGGN